MLENLCYYLKGVWLLVIIEGFDLILLELVCETEVIPKPSKGLQCKEYYKPLPKCILKVSNEIIEQVSFNYVGTLITEDAKYRKEIKR